MTPEILSVNITMPAWFVAIVLILLLINLVLDLWQVILRIQIRNIERERLKTLRTIEKETMSITADFKEGAAGE